jgi:hypothetical protein
MTLDLTHSTGEDTPDKDWRKYEQQIYERLHEIAEGADVRFDQKLRGRFSKVDRQVDVFVEGDFPGFGKATMGVDCKCFSEEVDVIHVEAFLGLIEDIGTDMGLMVTTIGYTPAAKNRAATGPRGIRLDIVPYEELAEWEPPWHFCDACNSPDDDWFGVVDFGRLPDIDGPPGCDLVQSVGRCDRCQTPHVECACGVITPVYSEGDWTECEGGCGTEFKVVEETDRKGVPLGDDWEFRKQDSDS